MAAALLPFPLSAAEVMSAGKMAESRSGPQCPPETGATAAPVRPPQGWACVLGLFSVLCAVGPSGATTHWVVTEDGKIQQQMTRLVLPGMLERSKGVILNISSASGMYPVPLLTVYSATKSVLPFFVATKMSRIRKPTWDKPSPEDYVRSALNTVG